MQASDLQRFGGAAARFSAACLVATCGLAAPAHAQLSEPFPAVFDLESLRPSAGGDGSLGFVLRPDWDDSGASVASAGDINGDGVDDFIIGATGSYSSICGCHYPVKGRAYVVFGRAGGGFPAELSLADLDGSNGFRLDGRFDDLAGASVASAGDVNGDGVDDIIIGAPSPYVIGSGAGSAYVVFGRAGRPFPPVLDLSSLDGEGGFRLDGVDWYDHAGASVASAGDVNGDGVDDIIIGAPHASPADNRRRAGAAYVVFGRAGGGFPAALDLGGLDGSTGFRLDGVDPWSSGAGRSVASVGDMNNDGVTDIAVGAARDRWSPGVRPGRAYVVFGRAHAPFPSSLDLSTLDGTNGFRLDGSAVGDRAGASISSAGDVNGDGVADLLLGAPGAERGYPPPAGAAYVIFGRRDGTFAASVELSSLDGHTGFRLENADADNLGASVASAGDINGDGVDDLIVQSSTYYYQFRSVRGRGYVVFGQRDALFPPVFDLATLDGVRGFRLDTPLARADYARAVASAGDVNGDGAGDVILDHYIVFGRHRCDADCDASGALDFFDFLCFQNQFAAGDPAADCDGSGSLDFFDFLCFQNDFAAGCP